ncbi:Uncharacterised protein [Yersinia massiliensis]|nr:Uncharacterised protein [Yersinia massiliensis]
MLKGRARFMSDCFFIESFWLNCLVGITGEFGDKILFI